MRNSVRVRLGAAIALVLLMAAACGRDDGTGVRTIDEGTGSASASGPGAGGSPSGSAPSGAEAVLDPAKVTTRVNVTLREWTLTPQPAQAKAGPIAFDVKNEGETLHEVVVLRAPSVEALPAAPDGTADESKLGAQDNIGEIEVPVGQAGAVAFQMEPGTYVLICNILDEHGHAHFKEGMRATFTVT
jgi:uncharacterized cupredoxin-like copper-binding protein